MADQTYDMTAFKAPSWAADWCARCDWAQTCTDCRACWVDNPSPPNFARNRS